MSTTCGRPSARRSIAGLPSGSLDDAIGQIEELARSSVLPMCPRARRRRPATAAPRRRRPTHRCHGHHSSPGTGNADGPQRPDGSPSPRTAPRVRLQRRLHHRHRPRRRRQPPRCRRHPPSRATTCRSGGMTTATPASPVTVIAAVTQPAQRRTVPARLRHRHHHRGAAHRRGQPGAGPELGPGHLHRWPILALFGGAHLAIRRFAPYADPLLLPVVALLNGLGLVMIHRLDLASGDATAGGLRGPSANQQMLWTLVGVVGFSLVVVFLRDHRLLARYGYVCGLVGLVLLAIPALPAAVGLRAERRKDLDSSCPASPFSPPSSPRSCC